VGGDNHKELNNHVVWEMIMIKNWKFSHWVGDDFVEEHEVYPGWVGDDSDENEVHILTMG
jgi:hypothetical protein